MAGATSVHISLPMRKRPGSGALSCSSTNRTSSVYPDVLLYIGGNWTAGARGRTLDVINPATEEPVGTVASAEAADLEDAAVSAAAGFKVWRGMSAYERGKILHRAADLLRARVAPIARLLTLEEGKPIREAEAEVIGSADIIDWFAEEGRRAYGRVVPARGPDILQTVRKEPVGPVAAFTPWNFPVHLSIRKLAAALAAGCSVILKGAEETPASCAAIAQAFADSGLPAGVLNLVFGDPAEISDFLIAHEAVRKISFTGSTAVGKHLAAQAGRHMKPFTMELGGHAPVVVFEDADLDCAVSTMCAQKFRNAGQICAAPTRFLIQQPVYAAFVERLSSAAMSLRVGDGLDPRSTMGPLANERRLAAMERFVADATARGARLHAGGSRIGNRGYFFAPTVLGDVPVEAEVMNEEPFGPIALCRPFADLDAAVAEANRLRYGLAAYAFSRSQSTVQAIGAALECGMISINHYGLTLPETPFGGVKDSGIGSEGGSEGMESYMVTKFITQSSV